MVSSLHLEGVQACMPSWEQRLMEELNKCLPFRISVLFPRKAGELSCPCNCFNSMEVFDLKLHTSSSPPSLFTFSIITESLLTDHTKEGVYRVLACLSWKEIQGESQCLLFLPSGFCNWECANFQSPVTFCFA